MSGETTRVSTVARVTLTIEIDVADSWGDDCTTGQVERQARESAVAAVRRGLVINNLKCGDDVKTYARVIGEPLVDMIIRRSPR